MTRIATVESGPPPRENACGSNFQVVSTAEGYERWAPHYDHDPNPLLAREERYLAPLLGSLRGRQALDVACGTGRWLTKLGGGGAAGVGIDLSLAMLRRAKAKPASSRLAAADCACLPFHSNAFDLAICSFALGHISNLDAMTRELSRVMKVGADVYISDLHPDSVAYGWRVGFRDDASAVQIETVAHSASEIVDTFCAHEFECVRREELWLEEAERPLFEIAGKLDSYATAQQIPAVLVCHFRRLPSQSCRTAAAVE